MYITVSRAFRPWASDAARAKRKREMEEKKRQNQRVYIWLDGGINNIVSPGADLTR